MSRRVTVGILVTLLSLFLPPAACPSAFAASGAEAAIAVAGNRHIDASMIRSHFHAGADGRFDAAALDAALKSLYATGLFQDVTVSRDGDRILVKVVENPTIERMAFEGNKKIKDEDLKKTVQSKAGGPLARAGVHGDAERIIELYRQRGYFAVRVDPKTIRARDERVNLVFEITEGDKLVVRQILFIGNNAYAANKLKGEIKSGETNLLSFLLDNDVYNADRIEGDLDLLRRFYLAHGYADVRVHSAASYETDRKGIVLTFAIEEGPRYRLGRVEVVSDLKAVDAAALNRYLRTQAGETYNADAVNKTVEDATIGLAKSGEPFAAVLVRSERVPASAASANAGGDRAGIINLVYAVEPGKRVYVERIDIHGDTKTRDAVIRREFDFGEGDGYNRALVERAERRLKALGYFKSVKIATQPGSAPDRIVIDVTVEEDQTGNFYISGGYSTAGGALASVTVGDANFLGTGDIARVSVTYGQYVRGFDLSFTDPYALGPRLSLGVDLFGKETLAGSYQSFDSTVYGAKVSLGAPLTEELGMQWNYSIYNQSVRSIRRRAHPRCPLCRRRRPVRCGCPRSAPASPTARSTIRRTRRAACACRPTTSLPASAAPPNSPAPPRTRATTTKSSATWSAWRGRRPATPRPGAGSRCRCSTASSAGRS